MTFIYVKDLVRVILDAAVSSHSERAYFITDGQTYTGDAFGEYVKKHLGKKTLNIPVSGSMMKFIARTLELFYSFFGKTPGLNAEKAIELSCLNWVCDISPAVYELGFKPRYTLEQAIQETASWYKMDGWI